MIYKTCICCKHSTHTDAYYHLNNYDRWKAVRHSFEVNEIACWVRKFSELLQSCLKSIEFASLSLSAPYHWPNIRTRMHKLHKICMIAFFGRRQHGANHCFIRMFAYVHFIFVKILLHFFVSLTIEIRVCLIGLLLKMHSSTYVLLFGVFDHHRCFIRSFVHSYG